MQLENSTNITSRSFFKLASTRIFYNAYVSYCETLDNCYPKPVTHPKLAILKTFHQPFAIGHSHSHMLPT